MFVIVAVEAEEHPVAAVVRVVVVVMILVMDRQLAQALTGELPATARTDVREQLEGAGAIAGSPHMLIAAELPEKPRLPLSIGLCRLLLHRTIMKCPEALRNSDIGSAETVDRWGCRLHYHPHNRHTLQTGRTHADTSPN